MKTADLKRPSINVSTSDLAHLSSNLHESVCKSEGLPQDLMVKLKLAMKYIGEAQTYLDAKMISSMETFDPLKAARIIEDAGVTCSSSVAISPTVLGDDEFSRKDITKKLKGYSNVLSKGKPMKAPK
jgi:hypothetical protein